MRRAEDRASCDAEQAAGAAAWGSGPAGGGSVRCTFESIRSSFSRPIATCRSCRGVVRCSVRLTLTSGRVTSSATRRPNPACWIWACLRSPSASSSAARHNDVSRTTIPRPRRCREQPHLEPEVDEGRDPFRAERVDQHQADGHRDRLRRHRQTAEAAKKAHFSAPLPTYWLPIPTTIASRTEVVTSGDD